MPFLVGQLQTVNVVLNIIVYIKKVCNIDSAIGLDGEENDPKPEESLQQVTESSVNVPGYSQVQFTLGDATDQDSQNGSSALIAARKTRISKSGLASLKNRYYLYYILFYLFFYRFC